MPVSLPIAPHMPLSAATAPSGRRTLDEQLRLASFHSHSRARALITMYTTNDFPGEYIPNVWDNPVPLRSIASLSFPDAGSSRLTCSLMASRSLSPTGTWPVRMTTIGPSHLLSCGLPDRAAGSLRPLSYTQTDVFILCFRINNRASFNRIAEKVTCSICANFVVSHWGSSVGARGRAALPGSALCAGRSAGRPP